jgi:hypothetical protein
MHASSLPCVGLPEGALSKPLRLSQLHVPLARGTLAVLLLPGPALANLRMLDTNMLTEFHHMVGIDKQLVSSKMFARALRVR